MITIDKVKRGLANFADKEIISKAPGGSFKKIALGTAVGLYLSNLENLVMQNKDSMLISALGVIHPDGSIDIEKLATAVKENVPEEGMRINIDVLGARIADMTLRRSDIDDIVNYIYNS
jgi:hypothetical protein